MTNGLPPAPWRPPEPSRGPGPGLLIALVATLIVLPVVALVGLLGWGFYVFASHDPIELIDNPATIEAIARPCSEMTTAADSLDLGGPPQARAESLLAFSTAARVIPETVASFEADFVHDDFPTESWGRDWAMLLDSVDAYARSLQSGEPATFEMPMTPDGYPIVERMDWAEPGGCQVPAVLADLTPDTPPI